MFFAFFGGGGPGWGSKWPKIDLRSFWMTPNLPWDSSESSSSNIGDLVIGKIESAHETHASETICIEPSKFIVVHVEYSQETISCKNSSMNFADIVVRYIEPQEPIEIGEEMGLQFAQAVVRQI